MWGAKPRLPGVQCGITLKSSVTDPVPDPDPYLYKFSDKLLQKLFLAEICFKKYVHEPKRSATGNPKVFMSFIHTEKVDIGSFIKARIRNRIRSQTSVRIRIRPKRSGSDRIRIRNTAKIRCRLGDATLDNFLFAK
jgi:hypothetical protein